MVMRGSDNTRDETTTRKDDDNERKEQGEAKQNSERKQGKPEGNSGEAVGWQESDDSGTWQ